MSSPIPPSHTIRSPLSPSATGGPRLNLLLKPSLSLGPFRLGVSLWHTIDYLRSHQSLFPQFNVTYDEDAPRLSPILITIKPNLTLVYPGTSQRLAMITLDNLDAPAEKSPDPSHRPVNVIYNGKTILAAGSDSIILSRSSLHQILGPTYPGWTQKQTDGFHDFVATTDSKGALAKSRIDRQEFVLGYPGVAFTFTKKGPENGEIDKLQPASSIHVFNGSDLKEPEDVILHPSFSSSPAHHPTGLSSPTDKNKGSLSPTHPHQQESILSTLAEAERTALSTKAINIRAPCLLDATIEPNKGMTLHFSRTLGSRTPSPLPPANEADPESQTVQLLLGVTTPQDALCDLGSPQRTFYKEDDRMRIHGSSSRGRRRERSSEGTDSDHDEQTSDDGTPFFFNYFDLGLDLLFSDGRLEKIVSHTNVAGDALFQRYNRCPWRVVGKKAFSFKDGYGEMLERLSGGKDGTLSMELDRGTCAEFSGRGVKNVKLDLSTELVGRDGMVLEVAKDDSIVSVVVF